MKKIFGFAAFLAVAMLLLPLGVVNNSQKNILTVSAKPTTEKKQSVETTFKVLLNDTVTELPANDYIMGVVAAEMPALYHEEALKAQAVAAYTFACNRKLTNTDKDYDITTDCTIDQSYITESERKEKWGDKADEYTKKLENAIDDVQGYIITNNGEPITAVYHAISSGKTEDCKNVWGSERSYLKPVSSEGDRLADTYISKVKLSYDEVAKIFNLSGEKENYFTDIKRTDSQTVTEISVCGEKYSGFDLQKLINLRSANFEVMYSDDEFIFTVYGYGHGVGMSQNGANYMANQGSNFKEILSHYYTDCKIEKVN